MRILHTSDWHLDAKLEQISRLDEQKRFLDWLADTIIERKIDALIVAGDIFDSSTPSLRAAKLYMNFIQRVYLDRQRGVSCCRYVVLVGGNHDSPGYLEAPKNVLELLNVHIVAIPPDDKREMLFPLRGADGRCECIVAAVPYLPDRFIRQSGEGENLEERTRNLLLGIRNFYREVAQEAVALRESIAAERPEECGEKISLIATGHLFAAHGKTLDGDGTRPIHQVGTLAQFPAADFPPEFDYIALGHLHLPQIAEGFQHVRYSGAPIPIGSEETRTQKQLVEIVAVPGRALEMDWLEVPCFHKIRILKGGIDEVLAQTMELRNSGTEWWLKVQCKGEYDNYDGIRLLHDICAGSLLRLLHVEMQIKKRESNEEIYPQKEYLEPMSEEEVFRKFLETKNIAPEEVGEIQATFGEALEAYFANEKTNGGKNEID
ncbi:MAG: exonuclease SbcCD subunit D C-terminal domain-containing protein [Planctomycetia bacterium]|nr:exonuclease SbcCD subunit D C-terminal domain-containing protein [Planctomycetia bacterium]